MPAPGWKTKAAGLFGFVLLAAVLQFLVQALNPGPWRPADLVAPALVLGLAYAVLYRLIAAGEPVRLTLLFLLLPYPLFAFGWLHAPLALLWVIVLAVAAWHCWQDAPPRAAEVAAPCSRLVAFLLVLAWVYLSGAGGYGMQTGDYVMHNGRLRDLIERPWPVRYDSGDYLVFYLAYYLPGAAVGKYLNPAWVQPFMHLWTLAGAWLALRWLLVLSGSGRGAWLLALLFVFWGGWDMIGYSLRQGLWPWQLDWAGLLAWPEPLYFWIGSLPGFFVGSFPSHTFSLFWAPHQTLAGWLVMALMTHYFLAGRQRSLLVIHGLLSLWSPMIAVALLPYTLVALLHDGRRSLRAAVSVPALLFVVAVVPVLGLYYLSGSAAEHPLFVVWQRLPFWLWLLLPLQMLLGWGVYLLAMRWAGLPPHGRERCWWLALLFSLLLLPQVHYGTYNDLFCRGAVPSLFLLLLLYWRTVQYAWQGQRRVVALLLLALALPGSLSAGIGMARSLAHYEYRKPAQSIPDYHWGWQFLGPADGPFMRHLMRTPQAAAASGH